ncbi:hypothetical protein MPSEU_000955500 [Mayamaea pseudoterrestris]|nr:hypothetical protein MPSEU_000955500 [Mayamaea pseudoterrestris]
MPLTTFSSCPFSPNITTTGSGSTIDRSDDGSWKLAGFFQDSSLRSTIALPLQIECLSQQALDELLSTKFLNVICKDKLSAEAASAVEETIEKEAALVTNKSSQFSLSIEAKVLLTFGTGEALSALVENVVIKSGHVKDLCIHLETELTVRVRSEAGRLVDPNSLVKINLEIGAVLMETLPIQTEAEAAVASLKALNLGGLPEIGLESQQQQRVQFARLKPFELVVSLTFAMKITAQSFSSHNMGEIYVSLTMSHSNMHSMPLSVTNIALHPGHSVVQSFDRKLQKQQQNIHDMSRHVKWTYAPSCSPSLPLLLKPHESYSTCLVVYATGDKTTRSFSSPISVTATILGESTETTKQCQSIVAACDVQWTTCRAAVEPADAFGIHLSVLNSDSIMVGALLTVNVKITNLSSESKQLMILVDSSREVGVLTDKNENAKTAVVSTKGGARFGVWGLKDDQFCDGTSSATEVTSDIDRELLTVDVAILVGDVNPGAVTKTELRFVALREGTLRIPNFKIIDRRKGKWYSAVHTLQLVAQPAGPDV